MSQYTLTWDVGSKEDMLNNFFYQNTEKRLSIDLSHTAHFLLHNALNSSDVNNMNYFMYYIPFSR
jgi:hypothetical protein